MSKHENQIEVLARGVCVVDGHLLYCHSKGADKTYLPGGHVEFNESAPEALRREIVEEMAMEPRVGEFLGAVEHTFIQKSKLHCEINLVFHFEADGLDPAHVPQSCEHKIEFGWISFSELKRSPLEPALLRDRVPQWLTSGADSAKWGSSY